MLLRSNWRGVGRVFAVALLLICACAAARAAEGLEAIKKIEAISLEDLLNREVTSVLKKPGTLWEAPTAVFVITGEDIRRSGVRHIADALRMAPGVMVAHLDQSTWSITARGLDKRRHQRGLQVLIDGRSVYTPTFSGVFWDTVDYVLEDIDRIEVIRGPGGAVWGANAVDGVINIITKDARKTTGFYATAGGGNVEQGFGAVRYGTRLGENAALRGYVKYSNLSDAAFGDDGWDYLQTGFRADWEAEKNHLTLEGDFFRGNLSTRRIYPRISVPSTNAVVAEDFNTSGGDLVFTWTHQISAESQLSLLATYDHMDRDGSIPDDLIEDKVDVEVQHRLPLPLNQDFQWGVGYRYFPNRLSNRGDAQTTFDPAVRHEQLFTSFVQDEVGFFDRKLRFVIGSRFEHHDPTGWEFIPSARLSWVPSEQHTLWAAVSRGIRIPDRSQRDTRNTVHFGGPLSFPSTPLPVFFSGAGSADSAAEKLIAYELGYRVLPHPRLSLDLAGFYNDFSDFVTGQVRSELTQFVPTPFPHLEIPVTAVNTATAQSYGGELAVSWQAAEGWRLSGGYAYVQWHAQDAFHVTEAGTEPHHQVTLRSALDLPGNLELDLWGRYVDARTALDVGSYFGLDARLAWRPVKSLELAVVGQNLIEPRRVEAVMTPYYATEITPVGRGVYFQATCRF